MTKEYLKFTLLTIIGITLFSCGDEITYQTFEEIKQEYEEPTKDLAGYYYLENGGEIEILKDHFGRYTITQMDYVVTVNPKNDTYAIHPKTNISDRFMTESKEIKFSVDVNYTNQYDVEEDISGNNVQGKRKTNFVYKLKDDSLEIFIQIYSDETKNNPNYIVVERLIKGVE